VRTVHASTSVIVDGTVTHLLPLLEPGGIVSDAVVLSQRFASCLPIDHVCGIRILSVVASADFRITVGVVRVNLGVSACLAWVLPVGLGTSTSVFCGVPVILDSEEIIEALRLKNSKCLALCPHLTGVRVDVVREFQVCRLGEGLHLHASGPGDNAVEEVAIGARDGAHEKREADNTNLVAARLLLNEFLEVLWLEPHILHHLHGDCSLVRVLK